MTERYCLDIQIQSLFNFEFSLYILIENIKYFIIFAKRSGIVG